MSARHEPVDKILASGGDLGRIASELEHVPKAFPRRVNADPEQVERGLAQLVLTGDITLSVANVDLVYVGLRVLLSSVATLEEQRDRELHRVGAQP